MVFVAHIPESSYLTASNTRSQLLCLLTLAKNNPKGRFIFFMDQPLPEGVTATPNLEVRLVKPELRNKLLHHYWYRFKLPAIIEKEKATIFVSLQPALINSTLIPQHIWLSDLSFLHTKKNSSESRYRELFRLSHSIIVPGEQTMNQMKKRFQINSNMQSLRLPICDQEWPDNHEDNGYSNFIGVPLNADTIVHLKTLLKAFSFFKKRQQTEMNMLLIGNQEMKTQAEKILKGYKFIAQIHIRQIEHPSAAVPLLQKAYMNILLSEAPVMNDVSESLLLAAKPLVCVHENFWMDVFGEGALYVPINEEALGTNMMALYKNEDQKMAREQYLVGLKQLSSISRIAKELQNILLDTPLHSS